MKTILILIALASTTQAQEVVIIQPRPQSNSLWNPANPNRPWLDYNGRTGREREAGTVRQWVVTPIRGRLFPSVQPMGKTVVIVNPFAK